MGFKGAKLLGANPFRFNWCPRPDSNGDLRLRRPALYPLELRGHLTETSIGRARQDLNLRPLAPEASALSGLSYGRTENPYKLLTWRARWDLNPGPLAPQASALSGLSYGRTYGGGTGIRTRGRGFNPATA